MRFVNIKSLSQQQKEFLRLSWDENHRDETLRVTERFLRAILPFIIDTRDHDYFPEDTSSQKEELEAAKSVMQQFCERHNYFIGQVVRDGINYLNDPDLNILKTLNLQKYFF